MNKKIILFGLFILVFASFVNASLTDNNTLYYSFDIGDTSGATMIDLSGNGKNGSCNMDSNCNTVKGKLINASYFDGTNDNIINSAIARPAYVTIIAWINFTDATAEAIVGADDVATGAAKRSWQFKVATDAGNRKLYAYVFGSSASGGGWCSSALSLNTFYFVTMTYDGSDIKCYVNGVLNGTVSSPQGTIVSGNGIAVGSQSHTSLTEFFNGKIDEVGIWSRALNITEILELYNGGVGYNPYENITSNFTITARDFYWSADIANFSADISGVDYNSNISSKEIVTNISTSQLVNITISANGYYNKTYTNWNTSNDLQANLTIDHTTLNVSAYLYNSTLYNSFTATANSLNSSHNTSANATIGTATLELNWNETYNITVTADGLAEYNNSETILMDNYLEYLNITNLRETNTINITFKYEGNLSVASGVVIYLTLVSDLFSNNYSTSTGYSYLTLLTPEDYLISYYASGFPVRNYIFELTNRTYNELTLYLSTDYSNITTTVYDESGDEIEGATIEVLKYDISTNSYIQVEQASTNFQGITILHLTKNTVFYKFRIRYEGELKPILPSEVLTTNPTYIYSDSITFQIQTKDSVADTYFTVAGIDGNLTFNNATNNFRFDFSDSSGLTTQACVYVVKVTDLKTTDYNSSCVSASSGTILVGVAAVNGTTYKATAYVYPSGVQTFFDNLIQVFRSFYDTGKYGLFLIMLVTIAFAFISMSSPIAAIIMTPIPLLVASFIGFVNPVMIPIMILVEIGAIIIALILKDRV